jgi:hypothetical protein
MADFADDAAEITENYLQVAKMKLVIFAFGFSLGVVTLAIVQVL